MLTDRQINHLKTLLIEMKTEYEASEQLDDDEESMRHASGELSMYDNHPADMGTELYERERDQALEVHAASELDKVEQALQAIEIGRASCRERVRNRGVEDACKEAEERG